MAMICAHAAAASTVPLRLIYSVRTPADLIYACELSERSVASPLDVTYLYTRQALLRADRLAHQVPRGGLPPGAHHVPDQAHQDLLHRVALPGVAQHDGHLGS
jgi:ferredoxin-NADP reductase